MATTSNCAFVIVGKVVSSTERHSNAASAGPESVRSVAGTKQKAGMERVKGIEPSSVAWEAHEVPLLFNNLTTSSAPQSSGPTARFMRQKRRLSIDCGAAESTPDNECPAWSSEKRKGDKVAPSKIIAHGNDQLRSQMRARGQHLFLGEDLADNPPCQA